MKFSYTVLLHDTLCFKAFNFLNNFLSSDVYCKFVIKIGNENYKLLYENFKDFFLVYRRQQYLKTKLFGSNPIILLRGWGKAKRRSEYDTLNWKININMMYMQHIVCGTVVCAKKHVFVHMSLSFYAYLMGGNFSFLSSFIMEFSFFSPM